MNNWYRIHDNLIKMGPISQKPNIGKIFCIVTDGGWEPWSGKDILTKGLGGSETWIVETARNIKGYNVVVFCKTDKSEVFENVGYNPIELFPQFCANNVIDICIVSRFPEYVPVAIKGHAKQIGIIFHDLLSPDVILPVHPKLKWVFGLTDWHCDYIKKVFPMHNPIKINYGIDQSYKSEIKVKNSFIYSSFPNRGLVVLLKMWPRILEILPDATLNIFCNLDQKWVNDVIPEEMKEIKALLKVNKKGTINHGWVPKKVLAQAWSTAEYFLYPCKFEETFCLTAVEAAITKTFVITNGLAALGETVGDRGLIIPGNVLDITWQDECIQKIKTLTHEFKETKIIENHKWATEHSWKSQTELFMNHLVFEKHWYKIDKIEQYVIKIAEKFENIVDIGSGNVPFKLANVTIDGFSPATHKTNLECEELPHSFYDFIYCRHTLEDLTDNSLLLSEIKKKSKIGYLETPSPLAECCRGIDGDTDYNKIGYGHHHSILWVENEILYCIPKILKFMQNFDQTFIRNELFIDYMWNTYILYDTLDYVILPAPETELEYKSILLNAFKQTKISNKLFVSKLKIANDILNWTNDVPPQTRQSFDYVLSLLPKGSTVLEIGTYTGTSIIEILKIVPDSTAVVIDQWKEYHEHDNLEGIDTNLIDKDTESQFYKNTIEFKDRIKVLKGNSSDKLLGLLMKQVSFNFIYVDASHKCLDVYLDSMLAWKLLKIGGIMAFDDYHFNQGDTLNSPYEAIEHFKRTKLNDFVLIKEDYRVYLKKIN